MQDGTFMSLWIAALAAVAAMIGSSGCAVHVEGEVPVMQAYPVEARTALQVFARAYDGTDRCDLTRVGFVVSDEYFDGAAGGHLFWGHDHHVVVVRPEWEDQAARTVTHEMMHILAQCSGAHPDDNPAHDDPAIWGPDGVLAKVNASLGLPGDRD